MQAVLVSYTAVLSVIIIHVNVKDDHHSLSLFLKHTHTLLSGPRRSVNDMSLYINNIALLLQVRDPSVGLYTDCLTYDS